MAQYTSPAIEGVGPDVVLSRSWRSDAWISAGKCGDGVLMVLSILYVSELSADQRIILVVLRSGRKYLFV